MNKKGWELKIEADGGFFVPDEYYRELIGSAFGVPKHLLGTPDGTLEVCGKRTVFINGNTYNINRKILTL